MFASHRVYHAHPPGQSCTKLSRSIRACAPWQQPWNSLTSTVLLLSIGFVVDMHPQEHQLTIAPGRQCDPLSALEKPPNWRLARLDAKKQTKRAPPRSFNTTSSRHSPTTLDHAHVASHTQCAKVVGVDCGCVQCRCDGPALTVTTTLATDERVGRHSDRLVAVSSRKDPTGYAAAR